MATHVVKAARFIQMKDGKRVRHFKGAEITLTGEEAKTLESQGFVEPLASETPVDKPAAKSK